MSENTVSLKVKKVFADMSGVEQDKTGAEKNMEALVLQEHRLEILVNEQEVLRLVCTSEHLRELVVGRLITEQIIASYEDIEQLHFCESENRVRVFLKGNVSFCPAREEEPTCCTDNQVLLRNTAAKWHKLDAVSWKKEWIFGLVNTFAEDSKLHKSTGGTHSCMLAVRDRVLFKTEDIGRHNALDKAIGYAAMQKIAPQECILFTTGRVPTDMVKKVIAAGIPILVSKAVPTENAVEMAGEYGLNLLCRAWPDSFEIYA